MSNRELRGVCSASKSGAATYTYRYLQTAVSQSVLYHLKREMKAGFAGKQSMGMTIRLD